MSEKNETQPQAPQPDDLIIDMRGIVKRFYVGTPSELEILHGIDLQVRRGEFVAVVGASGSGKSTLMNIIGALDRPTEGTYYLDGVNVGKQGDRQLSKIRCAKIGFVFQTFNLVPRTNAIKNVELPMMYAGLSGFERTRRAKELLAMVEMSDRARHQPSELSGGQKQRVAIARSMANDPAIILADEPTGALDSKTGRLVMDLFHRLHEEQGKTIVLITHSKELAEECARVVTISDGHVVDVRAGKGRAAVSVGDGAVAPVAPVAQAAQAAPAPSTKSAPAAAAKNAQAAPAPLAKSAPAPAAQNAQAAPAPSAKPAPAAQAAQNAPAPSAKPAPAPAPQAAQAPAAKSPQRVQPPQTPVSVLPPKQGGDAHASV